MYSKYFSLGFTLNIPTNTGNRKNRLQFPAFSHILQVTYDSVAHHLRIYLRGLDGGVSQYPLHGSYRHALMHKKGRTGMTCGMVGEMLLHACQLAYLRQQPVGLAIVRNGGQRLGGGIAVDDVEGLPVEQQGERQTDVDVCLAHLQVQPF